MRTRALLWIAIASCCPPKTKTAPPPVAENPMPAPTPPPAPPPAPEPPKPVTQTAQPQELAFPDEDFRKAQPAPGPERPFHLPHVQTIKLKNGITAYLVEQHTLPIVSWDLTFDGGSLADPQGKEGLASQCMSLVGEGTQKLDKIAFSEALADLASSVSAYAGDDLQGVGASTLTKHVDETFALFADVVQTPGLRADDFDRLTKRRIESIKQQKGAPGSVAGRVSGPILYGPKHRLGRPVTEATLGAITLDDCKAYHAKWLHPRGARLFVFGDMTEEKLRGLFEGSALAGWAGSVPTAPAEPAPHMLAGRIFLVDIPGAQQSVVALMGFGPPRNANDYMQTMIMSSVLGGGFASRINMNLREDKGYSYGARAGFAYDRKRSVFSATAQVRTDSTYQSLLEIDKEVNALAAGGTPATDVEIDREKQGAILGLPAKFATGSSALQMYRSLVYYGLPLDYYASYVDKVKKVAGKAVGSAAKAHLKPGEAVYVVVGDANATMIVRDGKTDKPLEKDGKPVTLRAALTDLAASGKLGKGGLVVLDADGQVTK
ncbi:MAG TPA: pitrilysin family protein [Kofleriaceae bacterium]|nr:pitrilysin family protein [Kofleriaceae bacterium]